MLYTVQTGQAGRKGKKESRGREEKYFGPETQVGNLPFNCSYVLTYCITEFDEHNLY